MKATGILGHARTAVLWLATLVTVGASLVALWESYHALYLWALTHHVEGPRLWPLCVDAFIVAGETALFLAMVDGWRRWGRVWPWTVVAIGLAVSVAANMGHVANSTWTDRATFAVPPLAAFLGLTVGLGILKRVMAGPSTTARPSTTAAAWSWKWSRSWPWLSATRAPQPSTTAAARPSTRTPRPSTAAAARPSTTARRPSTTAAARPSTTAAAQVAKLVNRDGITKTTELAKLTGLAERTARRYARDAREQRDQLPLEQANGHGYQHVG